jgi:hypothetical protein
VKLLYLKHDQWVDPGMRSNTREDLFENDEDRKKIMSLPELEREMILFERQQKIEEAIEKKKLLEKVKVIEGGLKETPEGKREPVPEYILSGRSILPLIITRKFIAENFFRPDFLKVIKGLFVRLALDKNTYRVCEIVKINNSPSYDVDDQTINKRAILRQGTSEKEFKFDVVSNGEVQKSELDYFINLEIKGKLKPESYYTNKANELKEFITKPISAEILEHIVNEKKKLKNIPSKREIEKSDEKPKQFEHKYTSPHFLKLEVTSNDPNDPFSRRKIFSSKTETINNNSTMKVEESNIENIFTPSLLYQLHDFDLEI